MKIEKHKSYISIFLFNTYFIIQTKKPWMVKKWFIYVDRGNGGWNFHLFPLHIHHNRRDEIC
jgi:hypothetical protein